VVLEERMIKGWLVGDMHAVDDVSIWTLKSKRLLSVSNVKKALFSPKQCSCELLLIFHNVYFTQKKASVYFIEKEALRLQIMKRNIGKNIKYAALS
jgi:hypothetical protein